MERKSIKTLLSCCVNELFGHQGYAIAAGFAAAAHLDSVLEVIARLDAANRKSSSSLFSFIKVSWMNDSVTLSVVVVNVCRRDIGVTFSVVVIVCRRDIGVTLSIVVVIVCRRDIGVTLSIVVIVCRRDIGVTLSVVVIVCRRDMGVTLIVVVIIVFRRDIIKLNTVDCVQTLVEVYHTQLRKSVTELYK